MKNLLFIFFISIFYIQDGFSDTTSRIKVLPDGTLTRVKDEPENVLNIDRDLLRKNCEAFSKFADVSFKARQKGATAASLFSLLPKDSPDSRTVMEAIIIHAFKQPLLGFKAGIDIESREFANAFFIECMS